MCSCTTAFSTRSDEVHKYIGVAKQLMAELLIAKEDLEGAEQLRNNFLTAAREAIGPF